MEFSYTLSGATPRIRKMTLGAASDVAGVPLIAGTAALAGPIKAGTVTALDQLGVQINVPLNSYQTAQNADGSENASIAEVIVNPDAVYKVKLSGGAGTDTALTTHTEQTGSTTGLVMTSAALTLFDEGTVHCVTGANAGISRRVASIAANAATVTVAFPRDIAVGDTFIIVPYAPDTADQFVQLTTALTQLNSAVTTDTNNANFRVVELKLESETDSFAYIVAVDHLYGQGQ